MARITYQVPREGGVISNETGDACRIKVGNRTVRFVLQPWAGRDDVVDLVHLASGRIAVHHSTINAEQLSLVMRGHRVTLRFAAEACLRRIEHSLGSEVLLAKLEAAPVLNQ